MGGFQPYDHSFKLLTDDDPRAALAAFAGIPLSANVEVEVADRELHLTTLHVDNLYHCRQGDSEFLVHFEAVSRYKPEVLEKQAAYVEAIVAKYNLPCRSYLLLLTETGVPAELPKYWMIERGDYRARVRLRVVRLWTLPARRILGWGRLSLVPWVALMRASEEDIAEALRILVASKNSGLVSQFALLMGLRYDKKELFEERLAHMTTEEIIQDSYFYHWVLEKGEKIGEQRGLQIGEQRGLQIGEQRGLQIGEQRGLRIGEQRGEQRGLQKGVRRTVEHLLINRFGDLPDWTYEMLAAADDGTLDRWAINALTASSLEECLQ